MKKILTLALVLMLVFAFVACGDNESSEPAESTEPVANQEEQEQSEPSDAGDDSASSSESESSNPDELTSIPDFLAVYGLTEEDVMPEHFISFGEITLSGQLLPSEGGTAYLVIKADPEKTQADNIKAWFEQLSTAMKALSTDGKLHKNIVTIGTDDDEELDLEALYSDPLWEVMPGTMWGYPCQLSGEDILLNVSTSYVIETGEYKISFIPFDI